MICHTPRFFSDQSLYFFYEAGAAATYQKSFVTDGCTTGPCSSTETKQGGIFFKKVIYIHTHTHRHTYICFLKKYFAVAIVTDGGKLIPKEKPCSASVTGSVCTFGEQFQRLPSVGCIVCPGS